MPEERYRFTVRLSAEADHMMKKAMTIDNCQSQNEFTENAIRFYAGYIYAKDATEYLAPVLTQVMRGTLDGFDRMHRYLRVAASLPKSAVAATPQQASLNPRG